MSIFGLVFGFLGFGRGGGDSRPMTYKVICQSSQGHTYTLTGKYPFCLDTMPCLTRLSHLPSQRLQDVLTVFSVISRLTTVIYFKIPVAAWPLYDKNPYLPLVEIPQSSQSSCYQRWRPLRFLSCPRQPSRLLGHRLALAPHGSSGSPPVPGSYPTPH